MLSGQGLGKTWWVSRVAPAPNQSPLQYPLEDFPTVLRVRIHKTDSEGNVDDLLCLAREGGVEFLNQLLAKAVPPDSETPDTANVREWTFRDIIKMPRSAQQEWKQVAHKKLDSLCRHKVFELVDPPKGHKVIKNRWVFNLKSDGCKKARLVAKGFSQVEGIDYDTIFSPMVQFETVQLMIALAVLKN
jgi:hypothetical protein